MNETELLNKLVAHQYGTPMVKLHPVHQFVVDGRGIYRVELTQGPSQLLRAFRQANDNVIAWLTNSAAVLFFLEQQGYPAPKVIRTLDGALIGNYQDWSALMLTFVEGTVAENTLENLNSLGTLLGQLHNLYGSKAVTVTSPVRGSRFQPDGTISRLLEQLVAIGRQVPPELQTLYNLCLEMFQRVDHWRNLPSVILHTDCWIHNAIRTPTGQLVLVDWDGAGLGPAVLDVGYLLVACHVGLPQWPQLVPNADRIAAVVDGYCQQRKLAAEEIEALLESVQFAIIFNDAIDFSQMLQDEKLKDRNLQRFHVRYPAAEEIARLAKMYIYKWR